MGGGPQRRHSRAVHASGARPVRLSRGVLLAGAGSGSIEPRTKLDFQMRFGAEGLAENRPGVSMRTALLLTLISTLLPGADKISGGNGTLYLGGRPNKIFILDEATEKVTGEIMLKTGTPGGMSISQDRKRFYVHNIAFEDIEIVDIAQRKVIDSFRLSKGNK